MTPITRENIDSIIDNHQLFVAINNGNWWQARRNGMTKYWKRDKSRIYVPFKYGFNGYSAISETDFDRVIQPNGALSNGALSYSLFRHINDVPKKK